MSSARVVKRGCDLLHNLAMSNDDNRRCIGSSGGIKVVLAMMKTHGLSNAQIAEPICEMLRYLACNVDNKRTISSSNGIEDFLNMVKAHGSTNESIAVNGCAVICILAGDNDSRTNIPETHQAVAIVENVKLDWPNNKK